MNVEQVIEKCKQGLDITWEEYCLGANRTLSDKFFTDQVPVYMLVAALDDYIKAANNLDTIKKALFYGKDLKLDWSGDKHIAVIKEYALNIDTEEFNIDPKILHSILGIAGEAGELAELLKATLIGAELDITNLIEELGDIFWFTHIPYILTDTDVQTTLRANLLKLYARFGDKFTEDKAINRDLERERKTLEENI